MRGAHPRARSVRTAAVCAGLMALITPGSLVAHPAPHFSAGAPVAAPSHEHAGPKNYDIRWDLAVERAGKVAVSATRAQAEQRLSSRATGLTIHRDEISMLPKMVTTTVPGERLSAKGPTDAVTAARRFLDANREVYGLKAADVTSLDLVYTSEPKPGEPGATIVRFAQKVDGVPVFNAEIAVVMTPRDHAVVGTSGVIYPDAAAGVRTKTSALSIKDALAVAASDIAPRAVAASEFVETGLDQAGYLRFDFGPDRATPAATTFGEGLRARQVVFPISEGETVPAYYAEVIVQGVPEGSGPAFSFVVSAVDGSILFRNNLVASDTYSYRVFADTTTPFRPFDSPQGFSGSPHPTGLTDQFQAANVSTNDLAVESLLGPTDPWLAPGATTTTGNNVDAYLDITGADGFSTGDIRATLTAPGQFLHPFDPAASTMDATVRQSKIVHMFYYNNWLHDVWYPKGFNEASGNAQTDNYGRGGAGADSIKGEGEDKGNVFGSTNNANMLTPADGSRPRMQMYRFDAPEPERDSSTDFGIVAHEWMHYMSNRLIGNANGLNNNQGGSMGEGWGDWNGLTQIVRTGDDLDGVYTTGAWATYLLWTNYQDNYYYGIRRYPYSTRMDRFPLTFKDIGTGAVFPAGVPRNTNIPTTPSEVHNAGEIWSEMLWEATASLMKTYGIEGGRDRMMRYVADGMKNTPASPTYGQARDGIITAANASDPNDVPLLWQAFAKRGIGEGAVSPVSGSSNHSGITESFVAPVAMPDDTPGVFAAGVFFERNVLVGGNADVSPSYGSAALVPVMGNWDGGVGVGAVSADNLGAYDSATGAFFLRNSNTPGVADIVFTFGGGGALKPLAGDWNGDGTTTIGLYDPATGAFFLRNSNSAGVADVVFTFGGGGTLVPIVGDWNNDGTDTIGLYNPATGTFFLRNSNSAGAADLTFGFGAGGGQPIAGDWNSDGTDTVGLYNPATGVFFLRNANAGGPADRTYSFGPIGTGIAIAGNFDGQ